MDINAHGVLTLKGGGSIYRIVHQDKDTVLRRIHSGEIDAAKLSTTNLADEIMLSMHKRDVLSCIKAGFEDKRADNSYVPFEMVTTLSIAAKMRVNSSLSFIPYAITDHRLMCELGYNMIDTDRDVESAGLMSEGTIRALISKYDGDDFIAMYNTTVQNHIIPKQKIRPTIHALDTTKIKVNKKNQNYENATFGKDSKGASFFGYKLATLRGVVGNKVGIIEDICLGTAKDNDLALCKDMLMNSPVLKRGDILVCDRGFLSRQIIDYLKLVRGVDVYCPLKSNMLIAKEAVRIAQERNKWQQHPTRNGQKIQYVSGIDELWPDRKNAESASAPIGIAVVHAVDDDMHFCFASTDMDKTAKQIITTYQLRPEIEEDYRQIKDFWKMEDFKSTKYNFIAYHIICVLLAYQFFQLFILLTDGASYRGKSFPIAANMYTSKALTSLVIYVGDVFAILTVVEAFKLFADCGKEARRIFETVLKRV